MSFADEIRTVCDEAHADIAAKRGRHPMQQIAVEVVESILIGLYRRLTQRSSMATPYPQTFPAEAFDHVLAALRGQAEAKTLIHDAWEAAGFALGQFVGLPAAVGAAPEVLTEEEAVQRVCLAFENTGGGTMKATAIPPFVWEMVLKACLQLLEKFLAK